MKIDLEHIMVKLEASLKAKLNGKISAINTEKNDGITLKLIDNNAYCFQSLDEKVMNFDPFLYYGILEVPSRGEFQALSKSPKIEVTIVLADPQDASVYIQILRYQRALEELFTSEMFPIDGLRQKVKISSLEPVGFKLQNSTTLFKAIGVIIELDLFS